MKNFSFPAMVLFLGCLLYTPHSNGQVVVRERPGAPELVARPKAPGPRHVWVSGEYVWKAHKYIYVPGYWAIPPMNKRRWIEGRWRHKRGGWIWKPGYWR
ncbi:MAG: YXWGXW repeat-containing protein [Chitinophagaceae bacterium]|nr:YXWGXW repeat-containing protein [Bacteroidota bacterium]MCC6257243.1 YXWGXW repeat-containing protein [Chitinophagaceae bacterium]MCW5916134.1 YXWGXW repeat-containing protein [Ferruginibacter sp.]